MQKERDHQVQYVNPHKIIIRIHRNSPIVVPWLAYPPKKTRNVAKPKFVCQKKKMKLIRWCRHYRQTLTRYVENYVILLKYLMTYEMWKLSSVLQGSCGPVSEDSRPSVLIHTESTRRERTSKNSPSKFCQVLETSCNEEMLVNNSSMTKADQIGYKTLSSLVPVIADLMNLVAQQV